MKQSNSKIRLAIAVLAPVIALSSCGKEDKEESGEGEDKKTVTVKGKDGAEVKVDESVKLPADWPDDIPTPDGASIKMSQKMGTLGHNLVLHCKQPGPDLVAHYQKKMPSGGWEEKNAIAVPNGGMLSYSKGERTVNITIASNTDGKPTAVTMNLVSKKP